MELSLKLSTDDLAAIGHVVEDPEAWAKHAFEEVGAKAVRDKITKYRADYEAAKSKYGEGYKTRAQREVEAAAKLAADEKERQDALKKEAEEKAVAAAAQAEIEAKARDEAFRNAVAAEVAAQLKAN